MCWLSVGSTASAQKRRPDRPQNPLVASVRQPKAFERLVGDEPAHWDRAAGAFAAMTVDHHPIRPSVVPAEAAAYGLRDASPSATSPERGNSRLRLTVGHIGRWIDNVTLRAPGATASSCRVRPDAAYHFPRRSAPDREHPSERRIRRRIGNCARTFGPSRLNEHIRRYAVLSSVAPWSYGIKLRSGAAPRRHTDVFPPGSVATLRCATHHPSSSSARPCRPPRSAPPRTHSAPVPPAC